MNLFIGKTFKIISNNIVSHAKIIDIEDKFVIVLIDGKKFKMNKENLINKFFEYEIEKSHTVKCENCMEYKKGNCFGKSQTCNDFRPSPEILENEKDNWPKYGSVSRIKSDKYIIRDYDFLHSSCYY